MAEDYYYIGEWWEKEYSTAEATVYRSKDGKKKLYVYWDGTREVVTAAEARPPIVMIMREIRALLNAIESTTVTIRIAQHFKEIESLARRGRKELEALEPNEKTQFTKRR